MSEVRLVVREAAGDWSGTIHGSFVDRAIAALSADPVTLAELEAALTRFAKPFSTFRHFASFSRRLDDEPYDAGLVVIDLVARLIVVDSTYSSPGLEGYIEYHNGDCCTDTFLRYHLAGDWLISTESISWQCLAERRRREIAARPKRDARAVFYGRPMLEFLAKECFAAFGRRHEIAAAVRAEWTQIARERLANQANLPPEMVDPGRLTEEEITPKTWPGQEEYAHPFRDTLKQIHATWLLTPRDDLAGACPREIALEWQDHIGWDVNDRSEQWSSLGKCPPGLETSSHAFQHGGFGTHELVVYYDLVRELLWSCWEQLADSVQSTVGDRLESMAVGDFLTTEIPRLERVRDAWLDAPDPEFHGRTPREVIDRERARLPEGVSGRHAMVDPDCPCCQMMGEMSGVFFWGLDGSGMDDEFAFDIRHRTREEWEEEQREWEERSRRYNAERSERERLGVTDAKSSPVWSRSFSVENNADLPLGIRVFGAGCHLAELIVRLRDGTDTESVPPETQRHIDQLNRDFGNLREVLQSAESNLAEALIEPVVDRFAETLATIAAARPALAEQCEALASDLRTFLDPPTPASAWESDEPDVPF